MPATAPATQRILTGTRFPGITDQVIVCLITIGRTLRGAPIELEVHPRHPRETVIYYPHHHALPPGSRLPDYARDVVWVVNGLHHGESILIEPKPGTIHPFADATFTITYPNALVSSGPVVPSQLPNHGQKPPYTWSYNLTLGGKHARATLDPVIIIDQDP